MNGEKHSGGSGGVSRREFLEAAGAAAFATAVTGFPRAEGAAEAAAGGIVLPRLPYAEDALEPVLSARTMGFHHGKHHKAYVDNLSKLAAGTEFAAMPLEKIVAAAAGDPKRVAIFNNAAQAWNHAFYWRSLKPKGGGEPAGDLQKRIEASFGSLDACKKALADAATGQFGSGWAWLVEAGGKISVEKTGNADTPISRGVKALLCVDVWEHAYYLDYQNRRADYVNAVIGNLVDWDFAAANLAGA